MAFEVLTIGRVSVDLYPQETGLSLSEVKSFDKFLGGSPTNVAVAASRYGHNSAVITRVGDDGFGEYVRGALRRFGVDDRYVGTDPVLRTPLVFAEIYPPDCFPLLFYREPKAPDMNIMAQDLDLDAIHLGADGIYWLSFAENEDSNLLDTDIPGVITDGSILFWNSVTEEVGVVAIEALVSTWVSDAIGRGVAIGAGIAAALPAIFYLAVPLRSMFPGGFAWKSRFVEIMSTQPQPAPGVETAWSEVAGHYILLAAFGIDLLAIGLGALFCLLAFRDAGGNRGGRWVGWCVAASLMTTVLVIVGRAMRPLHDVTYEVEVFLCELAVNLKMLLATMGTLLLLPVGINPQPLAP